MTKIFEILTNLIFISFIITVQSIDYGYFYDNIREEILFDEGYNIFKENLLLNSSNKTMDYFSSAKKNKFKIEYYSCPIYSISPNPITLIKVSFNVTEEDLKEKYTVKEVIMDFSYTNENKLVFPNHYYEEFSIEPNKTASNYARKNREKIIYDTFGFNIKSKHNLYFKITKILLVNFRKNKVNYLANLSGNVRNTYLDNNNVFDIYLKNLPEVFDLYVTLELFDNNFVNTTGEKVLVVQKNFNYPNYRVEEANPNKKMPIIALTFIFVAFVISVVFVLLILICC